MTDTTYDNIRDAMIDPLVENHGYDSDRLRAMNDWLLSGIYRSLVVGADTPEEIERSPR